MGIVNKSRSTEKKARVVESAANDTYHEEDQVQQDSDDYEDEENDQPGFNNLGNARDLSAAHKDLSSSPAKSKLNPKAEEDSEDEEKYLQEEEEMRQQLFQMEKSQEEI
jgi:hypothetical protein